MDLKTRFEDPTVSGMYDGPAMLDDMRAKAKAALAAGDDETEKKAAAELEAWKARVPPGGCASKDMVAHWTHWRLYINPYMPVPLVINTKPYNDFLVDTMLEAMVDAMLDALCKQRKSKSKPTSPSSSSKKVVERVKESASAPASQGK